MYQFIDEVQCFVPSIAIINDNDFVVQETAKKVIKTMWTCLESDNQLSLRYSMEWLIVLLFHKYPNICRETLLPQMQMVCVCVCVCSVCVCVCVCVCAVVLCFCEKALYKTIH